MVVAAGLHGWEHAQRADGLLARVVDVQVFQAPAHLLARDRLALAEFFLRHADRFHPQDAGCHAAHVVDGADARLVGQVALAGRVEFLADVVQHGVVARRIERHRRVALGRVARWNRVFLGAGPPDAQHFVAREAVALRRLDGNGVHHAPAPQDHVVRLGLADLQPLRLLFAAWRRDGNFDQFKAVLFRQRFEHGQRLLAEGRIVVQVHDLFAFQLVHATILVAQVFDHGGGLAPVAGDQWIDVGEDLAVGGVRAAVADHRHGDLVLRHAVQNAVGDAGGEGFDQGGAALLGFQALIAFDAARRVVFGFAFFPADLDAIHAAGLVDQVEVVDGAAVETGAAGRVGTHAVGRQGDVLLLVLGLDAAGHGECGTGDGGGQHERFDVFHCVSPLVLFDFKSTDIRLQGTNF